MRFLFLPIAGEAGVAGTAAITLAGVTAAATGTLTVKGTASVTLAGITSSAVGSVALKGAVSAALGNVTAVAAGALALKGTATVSLDAVTLAAAGTNGPRGQVNATLAGVSVVAAGALSIKGAAAVSLADLTATATGAIALKAFAAVTLGNVALSAAGGATGGLGSATITLDGVSASATGVLAIAGTAAVTLAAVTLSATATMEGDGFPAIPDIPVARETIYLVDLTVATVDLDPVYVGGQSPVPGVAAVGRAAVGANAPTGLGAVYDPPVEEVYHFADVDWTTIPTDGPAVFHDGRADQPLEIERTIPLSPYSQTRNTFGVGRLSLVNTDRGLQDLILNHSIDGRRVTVSVGSPNAARNTFQVIFRGLADAWGSATATHATIELRDRWRMLTTDPRPLFTGVGGIDGGQELRGKPKPLWIGRRRNVPLTFITNVPFPIYMASYLPLEALDYVKSKGRDMTFHASVPAMFAASTPPAGRYLVSLEEGLVGFGSQPDGAVTAGGRGLKVGGTYLSKSGELALWLMQTLCGMDPADIRTAAWNALTARWPWEVGAWFGTETVIGSAMVDAIMRPLHWWGDDQDGLVTCGSLDLPSRLGAPGGRLTRDEILSIDRIDWPAGAPWKRTRVTYDTNDLVQSASDLAEDIPSSWLSYATEAYRVLPKPNANVRAAHIGAFDGDPVITPYGDVNDANQAGDILARMNQGEVDLWRAETPDDRIRYPVGHVLSLDHPAVSMTGPKPALVAGTGFKADQRRATYLLVA